MHSALTMESLRSMTSTEVSRLTRGDLLKIAQSIHKDFQEERRGNPAATTNPKGPETTENDLLTTGTFREILREELDNRFQRVELLEKKVVQLEDIILKQQEAIELLKKKDLYCHLIISGLPEIPTATTDISAQESYDLRKTEALLSEITGPPASANIQIKKVTRLGRSTSDTQQRGAHPRRLKVVLGSTENRNLVLSNARKLKDNRNFSNVFINPDEPPLTRQENARLRKKLRQLRETHKDNPQVKIYIKSGKLYMNSDIIDSFSVGNQVF